jgi:hypothetical protein
MGGVRRERSRAIALRLRESVVAWLRDTTRQDGQTVTAFVRDLIEDARTTSGLPLPVAEVLREEAATLGFPWRLYVQHVLYRRSELVRARGPAFDSLAPAPSARPRPGRRAS